MSMFHLAQTVAIKSTEDSTTFVFFSGTWLLIWLIVAVLAIVAFWKIFTKAGQAGWKSIIPIYSAYILLKIVGRPGWWLLLFFIPVVNFVVSIIVMIDLAKSFGKSALFGVVALWFFSLIGLFILDFGDATYKGASAAPAATPATA